MREQPRTRTGVALLGVATLAIAMVTVGVSPRSPVGAEPAPAYSPVALPPALDTLTTLAELARSVQACAGDCTLLVHVWTPRMPLSRAAIPHLADAADRLEAEVRLLEHETLAEYAEAGHGHDEEGVAFADALLAAGALAHAPALVVVREGALLGHAILGYKSAAAYAAAVARRVAGEGPSSESPVRAAFAPATALDAPARTVADYEAVGVPGAYFRWVPGRDAIAYESNQRVFLLDLADGQSRLAPGFIDFVPTPDGRYFVTPGDVGGGLTFYDADEVFEGVERGRPGSVEPIFTDLVMRDQYPSVGILEADGTRTLYRVLTSWFEGVVYRDYDVRVDAASGASSVRPVSEPVRPCAGVALSTPIMSQDGREVAGRDEATGTTKIFRMLDGGRCEALADFGVATSKVAWHSDGRTLAFSVPRRRGGDGPDQGVFVLDRDGRALERVPGSERASRLAFPDFVGEDAVVFLVPGATMRQPSVFRVVGLAR